MMRQVRRDLPSGTVTFLFTDVEGSTKLLHEVGADAYAEVLADHRRVLRDAVAAHDGVEVDTQGDASFVAFPTAPDALAAVVQARRALADMPVRVRMGLHTGTPLMGEEGYVGVDVHRAARIAACGHGGQVLISASTASLVAADCLRDLGEHRLKDLTAAERLYQLGDDDFPPLRTLHQTNLPIPSTPFHGREQELRDVRALLRRDDVRLLTLTGAGGTGKTRLAAQAAGLASDDYPDGVWWVPLAPLQDAELVPATAGQALGASEDLAGHILDKRMLLLLDNFEQVISAAKDVAALLRTCPGLDVLVTSREPLRVTGEQEYPVPPLAHEESVDFFLARARAVEPDFHADETLVSEIGRRLDDLPLALELAAARVKALSPAQLLERLEHRLPLLTGGARDLPERQRTLRATIVWSYELLEPAEQHLFARLAVFRGGCTLDAAESVADADLDVLQSLADKSLVRHTGERFWMLETIREFATERLDESGEGEVFRRRLAHYFVALAEEAESALRRSETRSGWLDRLELEHDNMRAARDALEIAGDDERLLRLAGALWRFWYFRGRGAEGRRWLDEVLDTPSARPADRARALDGAALLALEAGDTETGRRRAEEGLAAHRLAGDAWGMAHSGFLLAHAVGNEGDTEESLRLFEASVREFREAGDQFHAALASYNVAVAVGELGDLDRSRTLHEENLRDAQASDDHHLVALTLDQLAQYARRDGRVEDALSMHKDSLRVRDDLGDQPAVAENLCRFARTLADAGRAETAVRLLSGAEALRRQIGSTSVHAVERLNDETLDITRSQLGEVGFAEAWEQGQALTMEEAVALALDS
jgi:predicted ATPase/class 3 adenylate cyclase